MTTYEKIKSLLELGTLKGVEVKGVKSGDIYLCVHLTERGEIVVLAEDRGIVRWCSPAVFNLEFDEPITPIPQKPKVLPVGTKVELLKIARDIGTWSSWGREVNIGGTGRIENVYDEAHGVFYNMGNGFVIPAYCVVPVFEEEEDVVEGLYVSPALSKKVAALNELISIRVKDDNGKVYILTPQE